jgi:predicted O-methyltransferase YrrM
MDLDLQAILDQTWQYLEQRGGGVYPYTDYVWLQNLVAEHQPKRILECGTALGLTCIAMAEAQPQAHITSIDKNREALQLAQSNIAQMGRQNQIQLIHGLFLEVIKDLPGASFDLTFFDGFAPGLTIFLELERVLKPGGLMVCGNLNLRGDVRKITTRMNNPCFYRSTSQHNDTIYGTKR